MGEINVPRDEQSALKAVDVELLERLIEECLHEETPHALQSLQLASCGIYVSSRLRAYQRALAEYGKAKAAKKRTETAYCARRAGSDLAHAVRQMKSRVEMEEKEGQFFYVDDLITQPYRFSERLTVRVSYRWRRSILDEWVHGSITFSHDVDLRPDYSVPQTDRKPSAAKQEQDRHERLFREWTHLMSLGLHSVRDYLRGGGDGRVIPQAFQAKTDSHSRGLNNFSAQFWAAPS